MGRGRQNKEEVISDAGGEPQVLEMILETMSL